MTEKVQVILGSKSDRKMANIFLAVLKELEIPYVVSIASCHWSAGEEYTGFTHNVSSMKIFALIGGMSFAAPGMFSATLRNLGYCRIIFGIPLDKSARSAIEELPAGTPVLTCGLNQTDVKASIINAALAIAGILSEDDLALKNRLGEWYLRKRKEKGIIYDVELQDGLIPDPEKKKEV